MSKIYTKNGDSGTTSLVTGERVSKSDARVCAYGDIDELISLLGLLRCESVENDSGLRAIQQDLMLCSAWVATASDVDRMKPIEPSRIQWLEAVIDAVTASIPPLKAFILPAGPRSAALFQVARTVCRRAERSIISLDDKRDTIRISISYLNRLSDLLFVLGRECTVHSEKSEDFWIP